MSDERLTRIEDKIDGLVSSVGKVNERLAAQAEILKSRGERITIIERQLRPLTKTLHMFIGVVKLLGVIGLTATIVEAATVFAEYLRK